MTWKRALRVFGAVIAVPVLMIADVQLRYIKRIHPANWSDARAEVVMVLGASIQRDGTPSAALQDRLDAGVKLYTEHRVSKILITGDDGEYHAAEIPVMRTYLLGKGIPESDILDDGKGYRTYESCKRAFEILKIRHALIVTQRFHMARALYLCNALGVDADGITADARSYDKASAFWIRDLAASAKAWWDVRIQTPNSPVDN